MSPRSPIALLPRLALMLFMLPGSATAMGLTWGGSSTTTTAPTTTTSTQTVVLPESQGPFGQPLLGPHRLALAPEGWVYVVDGQGGLHVLTARGEPMGSVPLPDRALAVAAAPGRAFVSTVGGRILTVDPAAARVVATADVGYALGPMGLAYDPASGLLWLAERDAGQLRAIRADGTTAFVARDGGGRSLTGAEDVAIDPVAGLAWIALDNDPGGPMALAFKLADGTWVRSALVGGTGTGLVTRGGGIAVDGSGRVFVSDQFAGSIQVADGAGSYLGAVSGFGWTPGRLRQPAGMAVRASDGALLVASADAGRIEQFGGSAAPAVCPGDSDCDGMPDWWEIKYGLDPYWAGDALLDYDHDGLTNLMEFRLGTDPRNPDTDGDGVSDGDEVLQGTNPLVDDRRPTLVTSNPRDVGPGLVRWSSTLQGGSGSCGVAWSQLSGPVVRLRGATTFAPSFVGRSAGEYSFSGVATCGQRASEPVTVTATIRDVAPRPDPGRIQVIHAGRSFRLDGSFSSDANGDSFALAWDQSLGRALGTSATGATLLGRAGEQGLLLFQLTASEGAGGLSAAAEVPVFVVDSDGRAPTAVVVTPVVAQVGVVVKLDATASVRSEEAAFLWQQVDGPAVALQGAETASPSFVPPAPGRYVFEVAVATEELRSPPAVVEVYVAPAGGALPVASIQPVSRAIVGEPLALDGSGSTGSGLTWRWRQVSGPAAGLTDSDLAVATVVPFGPGSYVFELIVETEGTVSLPNRVRFEASVAGAAIPKAVVVAVKGEGDAWTLDGRASAPVGLRYRWTQVGGPWVALDDPASATPSFRAKAGATYAFELEVDDGSVRSAPALVTVSTANGRDP